MERFIIRERIAGNEIEGTDTLEKAKKIINMYIFDDIADGNANDEIDGKTYENDFDENGNCFYEIYDTEKEKIIPINKKDIQDRILFNSKDFDFEANKGKKLNCVELVLNNKYETGTDIWIYPTKEIADKEAQELNESNKDKEYKYISIRYTVVDDGLECID